MKKTKATKRSNLYFLLFVFIIGFVSAYDTALIYIYSEDIEHLEQNPLGNWLLSQGGISLFIDVKSLCTLVAIIFGICLIKNKYRIALIPVLLFQLGLFYYLTFYDPISPSKFHHVSPFGDFIKFHLKNLGF